MAAAIMLAGCATPSPSALANNDPYERTNRDIFRLNQKIDSWTLRPTAETYNAHVPEPARDSMHNLLGNLDLPVTFINDLLQAEPKRAGQTFSRFLVNSTVGLGGLVDVASRVGVEEHSEDFGQTMAVWGAGEGPYLVLPFLGPDPPRDAAGQVVDVFMDPSLYLHMKQHIWWVTGRQYMKFVDLRARNIETLDDIERDSIDFYATTRSLYRQYRAKEIRNGKDTASAESNTPATNLP